MNWRRVLPYAAVAVVGIGIGSASAGGQKSESVAMAPPPTMAPAATLTHTATVTAPPATVTVTATSTITATITAPAVTQQPQALVAPRQARTTATADSGGSAYYSNCSAARAAGVTPLHRGDPGYARHLDRDNDGVACE